MAQRPITTQRPSRFQDTIDELTDGFSRLVRQHFELARTEVRQEAKGATRRLVLIGGAAIVALIGYVLTNFAIILVAGWLGGFGTMTVAAIILALLHLIAGAVAGAVAYRKLKAEDYGLPETNEELQRNKQWIKEIRDNSSQQNALPAETS